MYTDFMNRRGSQLTGFSVRQERDKMFTVSANIYQEFQWFFQVFEKRKGKENYNVTLKCNEEL